VPLQVSNWFSNARRRLKKTVAEPHLSWAGRISLYDSRVVGKQEPLDVGHGEVCDVIGDEECFLNLGQYRL